MYLCVGWIIKEPNFGTCRLLNFKRRVFNRAKSGPAEQMGTVRIKSHLLWQIYQPSHGLLRTYEGINQRNLKYLCQMLQLADKYASDITKYLSLEFNSRLCSAGNFLIMHLSSVNPIIGAYYENHIHYSQLDFKILLRDCKFFALSIVAKWHFPWEINLSDIDRQFFVKAFFLSNSRMSSQLQCNKHQPDFRGFFSLSFCKVFALQ